MEDELIDSKDSARTQDDFKPKHSGLPLGVRDLGLEDPLLGAPQIRRAVREEAPDQARSLPKNAQAAGNAPSAIDSPCGASLYRAVRHNCLDELKSLLSAGANPNAMFTGLAPLALAASWGRLEMVEALLSAGGDVHAVNKRGQTAAMAAAYDGQFLTLRRLVEAGADVEALDPDGRSLMDLAREALTDFRGETEREEDCLACLELIRAALETRELCQAALPAKKRSAARI
jgi:hypothetical protein